MAHAERISGEEYIFQHDNAAVHTAKIVKTFFDTNNIQVLWWPARSPDLNIIENVWGELTRYVHRGAKQFNSLQELKIAIEEGWSLISKKFIKKLYKSLPKRLLEVIERKGKCTHY
ncbi:Transposable element Tc3 transposase [Anthophora plagiata]